MGLTGQELVSLCEVGCLIVSSKEHTTRIGLTLASFQGREVAMLKHWFKGVYLIITSNSSGDGAVHAINLNRKIPNDPHAISRAHQTNIAKMDQLLQGEDGIIWASQH